MPLVRAFSRVNDEGRIPIPHHVRRLAGLRPGQLVEIRPAGGGKARNLVVLQMEGRSKETRKAPWTTK